MLSERLTNNVDKNRVTLYFSYITNLMRIGSVIPKLSKRDLDGEVPELASVRFKVASAGGSPCPFHFGLILMRGW